MDSDPTPIKSTEDDAVPTSSNSNQSHEIPDGCGANVTIGNEENENVVVIPDTDDVIIINSSSDDDINFQLQTTPQESRMLPMPTFDLDFLEDVTHDDETEKNPLPNLSSPVKDAPKVAATVSPVKSPIFAKSPLAGSSSGIATGSSPPTPASPTSYKILYVKPLTLPRSISHPSNVTTSSTSISQATPLNPTKQTNNENALNLLKLNYSSIRSSDSNGSESNASSDRSSRGSDGSGPSPSKCVRANETPKHVEHTVNLLNNNRIVIKSVKSTGSTPPSKSNFTTEHVAVTAVTTTATTSATVATASSISIEKNKSETDSVTAKANIESNTDIIDTTHRQQQPIHTNTDQSESNAKQSNCDASDNGKLVDRTDDNKCDTILPQHMVDKTSDNIVDTTSDHEPKLTRQIGRELKQLQKDVSKSKILTEFIQDQIGSSSRRPMQKSGRSRQKPANLADDTEDSTDAMANRDDSPALSESDRSASSAAGASSGKRNTRSRNSVFSAKQKKFLKGVKQLTRGTDDDSDAVAEDDVDDLDFRMKQDVNVKPTAPTERRKSVAMPILDTTTQVTNDFFFCGVSVDFLE